MANSRLTGGSRSNHLFGAVTVGTGGSLSLLKRGTFASSTAAINQFAALTTERTITGAVVGDFAIVYGSSSLDAGLTMEAIAPCYATSTINVTIINHSSAAVTQTSALSHSYTLVKLST